MHVVATAGHVDHGKSTLVRALTGTDPDRLAEERRRGLTIELGFAWTRLDDGDDLAFVDVPGHQRFLGTMLAGVGPVPAVLLVVAADEGWRRQTEEHLAALRGLGVTHGLVAITRADLADPATAAREVAEHVTGTPLAGAPSVAVSAHTGAGLPELRNAMKRMVSGLARPDPEARVRLWADRVFTVTGTGTVVTGTLGAGTLRVGDELEVGARRVRVRGLESLGVAREQVSGVARVAVALRGTDRASLRRGDALLTPAAWASTALVDVRLSNAAERVPSAVVLHVGAADVPVKLRLLGDGVARLTLSRPLPLEPGDRALLRDPGRQTVAAGVVVLDADPPVLRRRGAARWRASELSVRGAGDLRAEVERRRFTTRAQLRAAGVPGADAPAPAGVRVEGDHLIAESAWQGWRSDLVRAVADHHQAHPLDTGLPRAVLLTALGVGAASVLDALLREAISEGAVVAAGSGRLALPGQQPELPGAVAAALEQLQRRWAVQPFAAPEAGDLASLGLTPHTLGALAAGGHLVRLAGEVVLPVGVERSATARLADLPQPFSVSAARQALGTTRRVAVPLLEHLDRARLTRRDGSGQRVVTP